MSASAVATRAVPLSIANMEEEEAVPPPPPPPQPPAKQPEQPKCEEATMEEPQPHHQDNKPELRIDEEMIEAIEEPAVTTTGTNSAAESEAESERLQVDAQLRAMAVSATTRTTPTGAGPRPSAAARAHHDNAPSTATSTGTRSAGESFDDVNGKDRLKPFIRTCKKFESGSGSGDQDGMVSMEDGVDVAAKKRKTRRGKPKHRKLKPYSKQQPSYQQRLRCRASGRPTKPGRPQPPAPYNTTQFLMEDHNELPDLDEKIAGAATGSATVLAAAAAAAASEQLPPSCHFSKPVAPARTRDSSFSIDSDEEYFYSSPEDEEEFLSKEFSNVYEETHAERLSALTKAQLISEYIQLEAKVDGLTKRLRAKSSSSAAAQQPVTVEQPANGNDAELAKKLKAAQQRAEELQQQNDQLRRENELLRKQARHHAGPASSPMSSVDSESDSSDSSSSSHEASDCSDCVHKTSPGSSPVPASYHASCREKSGRRNRKNSSVSSLASQTDSTTNDSSCPGACSPKSPSTTTNTSNNTPTGTGNASNGTAAAEVANGHAASYEIVGLPT